MLLLGRAHCTGKTNSQNSYLSPRLLPIFRMNTERIQTVSMLCRYEGYKRLEHLDVENAFIPCRYLDFAFVL